MLRRFLRLATFGPAGREPDHSFGLLGCSHSKRGAPDDSWRFPRIRRSANEKHGSGRPLRCSAAIRPEQRIMKSLNLEDTCATCAFAIERSRGVILPSAVSVCRIPCCVQSGRAADRRCYIPNSLAKPLHIRSTPCPHVMETSPDSTGNANRKSLGGSAPTNC